MAQKFLNGIVSESDLTLDDGSGASPKLILKNSSDETWEIFNGTHGVLNFYENSDLRLSFAQGGEATFLAPIIANGNITSQTAGGASLNLRRDDTSVSGTNTLGSIKFQADDPTDGTFTNGAAILTKSDGSWGANSYPAQLLFQTRNTSDGLVTALTLAKDQSATFAGDVTLANGNSLRWTSDDVRIEATTASDNMKFYVGGSEILKLEQSGTLATFAGTVTATHFDGDGSSLTSVDADTLDTYQLAGSSSISTVTFNNKGQIHDTNQNFDTAVTPGFNYMRKGTNGPTNTEGHQWYGFMSGLGSDYGTSTGSSGHYANQLYWNRYSQGSNAYLWTRDMEGGAWASWRKMSAGDSDTLGGNLPSAFALSSVVNQTDFVSKTSGGTFEDSIIIKETNATIDTTGTTMLTLHNANTADISQQQSWIDFKFTDTNANYTPQVRIGAQVGPDADADAISKEGAGSFVVYTSPVGNNETGGSTGLAEQFRVSYDGTATFAGSITTTYVNSDGFTDGYITWNAAQLNRYGAAIELQYTPTNATTLVKIGANGSNPTIFNAYTGDATFSGQVIFPSAATTKPVLPNGFISRNDNSDTSDRHDIWGISERYYPSNSTAADAWGIQWSGTPNDIVFVGGGTDRFTVSLDEGNVTAAGTISASNFSGSSSGTNTGDQDLSGYLTTSFSDYVSKANGGTFGGDITIQHANTPSIKLKDTTDPDLEVRIRAANNYGYFEVDNTNTSGSSRLQMKIDGVNTATFLPNSFQTNTMIRIHDEDTPGVLDIKRKNTGGAILNGEDIGRIDFIAQDTVDVTAEINIGRITVEADGDYSSTSKKSNFKFFVNTGTSLENALTIGSDKSSTFVGDVTMTQSSGNNILFIDSSGGGNPVIYMEDSARRWGQFVSSGDLYFKNETTNVNTLILNGSNATFAGNVTASGGTGHFSIVNSSAYQLNGTYIVDSSRNLVNISKLRFGSSDAVIDTASATSATATTIVASVTHSVYNAAFFDFVIKNGTNVRAGTVYACHNGASTPLVEFAETSTVDLGDTSDVTLDVVISGANMVLRAITTSSTWTIKSLIRVI